MPSTTNFEEERQELEAVLASGVFSRAPSLAQLLIYICDKHFEGEERQIKEYNIAVEALGRPPEFDQKRDSIVRVEAHRLRRRLKEYYENSGADHRIHILVPSGQYAPRFIFPDSTRALVATNVSSNSVESAALIPIAAGPERHLETFQGPPLEFSTGSLGHRRSRPWMVAGAVFAGVLVLTAAVWAYRARANPAPVSGTQRPGETIPSAASGERIHILAGASKPYTDRFGNNWIPDRFYHGGSVASSSASPISGTRDPKIYQNRREGVFSYDIPLQPGCHELRLHFAEIVYGETNIAGGGETSRLFDISANGKKLLEALDIIADAGPDNAHIRVFKDIYPAPDGSLHLHFDPVNNSPILSGIEIVPGTPGKLRPIRIVARDQAYTDKSGQVWGADRFFRGGQSVVRPIAVLGTTEPEIYRGERFGNISYTIPVAKGRYGVVLHFAETWFGPEKPQRGGAGSRLFDILCNGVALARAFDIYAVAGGCDRALTRIYHGLEPTQQGKLVISFVPVRNYACVNAIEILDESGGT